MVPLAITARPLAPPSTTIGPDLSPLMTTLPACAVVLLIDVAVVPALTLTMAAGYAQFILTLAVAVWVTGPTIAEAVTLALVGVEEPVGSQIWATTVWLLNGAAILR